MRILVRAPNWLGDAVMALPAVRALRRSLPEAHIALLARAWVAGLYRRESCTDEIILVPGPYGWRRWISLVRLVARLRRARFDWALLLPNSLESALIPWLARIPRRTGYDRHGRGCLLTDAVAAPPRGSIPWHESFQYLELLRRAGVIASLPEPAPILLEGIEQARERGRQLVAAMGLGGPLVGISPGAQNSRAKQWPAERFVEAGERLAAELRARVVVFGTAAERALGQRVAAALRRHGTRVINLVGETTLEDFAALASVCRVFLSNDSGAMHLASALGVPTVAVFGPTEWFATGPAGPRAIVIREPVECSPCMLRDCPTDHRCMLRISSERVVSTALALVAEKPIHGHSPEDSAA